jgi:adenylate kinase
MPVKLILLGPPGAGKGTYAEILSKNYGIPIVSTGNILRESVQKGEELGRKAKSFMDSGKLVPDDVIIGIIKVRLGQKDCDKGFILDGFPRTVAQAQEFDKLGLKDLKVIYLDVPREILIKRLTSRRVCEKCSAPYNIISKPPKKEGVCDLCGGKLIQRTDDSEAVIMKRLMVYEEQTKPLIEFYEKKNSLNRVEGSNDIKEIVKQIISLI